MKNILIALLASLAYSTSHSQTWYFGAKAGIKFNGTNLPSALSSIDNKNVINSLEGTAMTNDNSGNLLFYTEGKNAYYKDGTLIPYAPGLTNDLGGNSGSTQCAVIVPVPEAGVNNCSKKYYIFTVKEATQSIAGFEVNQLEFTSAAPKGIITKKATLLSTNRLSEKITAVNDGMGGYWFLLHGFDPTATTNSKNFYKLHITPTSNFPVDADISSQTIGSGHYGTNMNAAGQLKFSIDRSKVAAALYQQNMIDIFDFSPSTGMLSNSVAITSVNGGSSAAIYGLEFSPNKKYLYATSIAGASPSDRGIFQIDLSNNSIKTIAPGVSNGFEFGLLQLGPDKRIYCANLNIDNGFIGVINDPDIGACNYIKKGIQLGSGTYSTLGLPTVIQNEASCGTVITSGGGGTTICGCPNVTNLITNGDFEAGAPGFTSKFTQMTRNLVPGNYTVAEYATYKNLCANWKVSNPATCPRGGAMQGKFLAINGQTGQTGFRTAWAQTLTVTTGKDYKLCLNLKNLPQCCFDVKPVIRIMYNYGNQSNFIGPITVNQANNDCDWLKYTTNISIPAGASPTSLLSLNIDLDQSGLGDGNDLAIDDISLIELNKLAAGSLRIAPNDVSTTFINTTDYTVSVPVTANPPLPAGSGIWWSVMELDGNDMEIPGTKVENPNSSWWNIPGVFPGYNGTALVSGTAPGIFKTHKKYKMTFGTWGECFAWTSASLILRIDPNSRKLVITSDNKLVEKPKSAQ